MTSSYRISNAETEVLIVGAGGAGLAAAVAAREKGANSVIALEKRGAPGGNTAMARGFFAAESKPQKQMKIDAPRAVLFKMQMDFTHWRTNPRLVRACIDKSADTVQWLENKGVIVTDIPRFYPNQLIPTWHLAGTDVPSGRVVVEALLANCEGLGVGLFHRTQVKKILTGKEGEVTGALTATTGGKEFSIRAKSVIISTGGYAGNKDLLKKYCPHYTNSMHLYGLPHQGEGLLMAMEIGAATEGLGILMAQAPFLERNMRSSPLLNCIIGEPNTLWVNKKGIRFVDESIVLRRHISSNPVTRQPGGIFYTLFDDKIVQRADKEGAMRGSYGRVIPSIKFTGLRKELLLKVGDKNIFKSDSWSKIAEWIGIAPDVLKTTVDEYNSCCDRRCDDIFAKESRYLQALRTPPYCAVKCYPGYVTTLGGIKINQHMEVLDRQDEPIPGLYAAGDAAGGWEYDSYNTALTGFGFGFAINSGRIAGENAAEYALRK